MERIVLAYDGGPAAASALEWVCDRAARAPVMVDVVHVGHTARGDRAGLDRLGDAEAFLHARLPDLEVGLHLIDGGMPGAIAQFSRDADLLVAGVNPGHPIRTALSGWMPLRLSALSRIPICMVPSGWMPRHDAITVGVADDDSSSGALEFAAAEAAATGVGLRLIHAWLMPTPSLEGSVALSIDPERILAHHRDVLEAAGRRVRAGHPGLRLDSELVRDSRAAALLRHAGCSSLIVLGTHGRGVVAGRLMGSVAQDLLWRAECPTCVVPAAVRGGDGGG